jgi:hypothetical protein
MKWAYLVIALALFVPSRLMADEAPSRELHYAGTTRVGSVTSSMTIDLDVGAVRRDYTTPIQIDEHVRGIDLGEHELVLDKSGVIPDESQTLTFEEETILDMLALQFENATGLGVGDEWDRSGGIMGGTHQTHYRVRQAADLIIDMDVTRTIDFANGNSGTWTGMMRYNADTVVPMAVLLTGDFLNNRDQTHHALAVTARLVGDSFTQQQQGHPQQEQQQP